MPEYLPSLLDRLNQGGADSNVGPGGRVSEAQFVDNLLRDLHWLLNHVHVEAMEPLLADLPQVRTSVLNFGIPPLAGKAAGDAWEAALSTALRKAIEAFEPRLKDVQVRLEKTSSGVAQSARPTRTLISLEIRARLCVQGGEVPVRLAGRLTPDEGRVALGPGESRGS